MIKVAIIGCGHGGQALAADLSHRGLQVTLFAHPKYPSAINAIAKAGGIDCHGKLEGFVPIYKATTNMEEAIQDSQYIFMVLPSFAHEPLFIEVLPFIKSGQTVITLAANFASLLYRKLLERTAKASGIDIIDVASLPYVCRADNKGGVEIIAIKKKLAAACLPKNTIDKHLSIIGPYFACPLTAYPDVLSLGMNITSGITHPAITIMNAGRIGKDKETFYFYRDGVSPEIASLLERLDNERMMIGQRLGLQMYSYLDLMAEYYGERYPTIYDFFRQSKAHNALPLCPTSVQERYITQDVACLLVPWFCLGKAISQKPTIMGDLISLASTLNKTNYLRLGHNLARLNLDERSIDEIKQYTSYGEAIAAQPEPETAAASSRAAPTYASSDVT